MELREKGVRGVATELGVPQGLVPGCAPTSLEPCEVAGPREHRWNPVAVLDERDGGSRDGGVRLEDVNRLGPEPLRRVDPAHESGVVRSTPCPCDMVQPL